MLIWKNTVRVAASSARKRTAPRSSARRAAAAPDARIAACCRGIIRKKEELTPLSLDFCYEDEDFDIEDKKTITPEDHMMLSSTLDELLEYLKEQNPRYYEIALLGLAGDDRETIVKKLPLQSSWAYEEFNKALHAAEKFLYENR